MLDQIWNFFSAALGANYQIDLFNTMGSQVVSRVIDTKDTQTRPNRKVSTGILRVTPDEFANVPDKTAISFRYQLQVYRLDGAKFDVYGDLLEFALKYKGKKIEFTDASGTVTGQLFLTFTLPYGGAKDTLNGVDREVVTLSGAGFYSDYTVTQNEVSIEVEVGGAWYALPIWQQGQFSGDLSATPYLADGAAYAAQQVQFSGNSITVQWPDFGERNAFITKMIQRIIGAVDGRFTARVRLTICAETATYKAIIEPTYTPQWAAPNILGVTITRSAD